MDCGKCFTGVATFIKALYEYNAAKKSLPLLPSTFNIGVQNVGNKAVQTRNTWFIANTEVAEAMSAAAQKYTGLFHEKVAIRALYHQITEEETSFQRLTAAKEDLIDKMNNLTQNMNPYSPLMGKTLDQIKTAKAQKLTSPESLALLFETEIRPNTPGTALQARHKECSTDGKSGKQLLKHNMKKFTQIRELLLMQVEHKAQELIKTKMDMAQNAFALLEAELRCTKQATYTDALVEYVEEDIAVGHRMWDMFAKHLMSMHSVASAEIALVATPPAAITMLAECMCIVFDEAKYFFPDRVEAVRNEGQQQSTDEAPPVDDDEPENAVSNSGKLTFGCFLQMPVKSYWPRAQEFLVLILTCPSMLINFDRSRLSLRLVELMRLYLVHWRIEQSFLHGEMLKVGRATELLGGWMLEMVHWFTEHTRGCKLVEALSKANSMQQTCDADVVVAEKQFAETGTKFNELEIKAAGIILSDCKMSARAEGGKLKMGESPLSVTTRAGRTAPPAPATARPRTVRKGSTIRPVSLPSLALPPKREAQPAQASAYESYASTVLAEDALAGICRSVSQPRDTKKNTPKNAPTYVAINRPRGDQELGLQLEAVKNDLPIVVAVKPGSLADEAGIKEGQLISSINGTRLQYETWNGTLPSVLMRQFEKPTQKFIIQVEDVAARVLRKDRVMHSDVANIRDAALLDSEAVITRLCHQGADIESTDSEGWTALHLAAHAGCENAVAALLRMGADVHALTSEEAAPLHLAAKSGTLTVVKALLRHGAELEMVDHDGNTPLHLAVLNGNDRIVSTLVQKKANVHALNAETSTPIHTAVTLNRPKTIERLVSVDYHDVFDASGQSPLHLAAALGSKQNVLMLIAANADVDLTDHSHRTPLVCAAESDLKCLRASKSAHGKRADYSQYEDQKTGESGASAGEDARVAQHTMFIDVIQALLDEDADFTTLDVHDRGILWYACKMPQSAFVVSTKLVIMRHVNVYLRDELYKTSASHSLDEAWFKVFKRLGTSQKMVLEYQDEEKRTLLHWAAIASNVQAIESFTQATANVAVQDHLGNTPMHYAALAHSTIILDMLVSCGHGADKANESTEGDDENMQRAALVNFRNLRGETAVQYAAMAGRAQHIKLLLSKGANAAEPDDLNCFPVHHAVGNCVELVRKTRETVNDVIHEPASWPCPSDFYRRLCDYSALRVALQMFNGTWCHFRGSSGGATASGGTQEGTQEGKQEEPVIITIDNGDVRFALPGGLHHSAHQEKKDGQKIEPHHGDWFLLNGTGVEFKVSRISSERIVWIPSAKDKPRAERATGKDEVVWVNKAAHYHSIQRRSIEAKMVVQTSSSPSEVVTAPLSARKKTRVARRTKCLREAAEASENKQISAELVQIVAELIGSGVCIHCVDDCKHGVMFYAAMAGADSAMIECLLARQADVNAIDGIGMGALHFAAMNGHHHIVEVLLRHDADPLKCEYLHDQSPLHLAAKNGHVRVCEALVASRRAEPCDENDADEIVDTHTRRRRDSFSGAEVLSPAAALLDTADKLGLTSADHALLANKPRTASFLINEGGGLNADMLTDVLIQILRGGAVARRGRGSSVFKKPNNVVAAVNKVIATPMEHSAEKDRFLRRLHDHGFYTACVLLQYGITLDGFENQVIDNAAQLKSTFFATALDVFFRLVPDVAPKCSLCHTSYVAANAGAREDASKKPHVVIKKTKSALGPKAAYCGHAFCRPCLELAIKKQIDSKSRWNTIRNAVRKSKSREDDHADNDGAVALSSSARAVREGGVFNLTCPSEGCQCILYIDDIRRLAGKATAKKYTSLRTSACKGRLRQILKTNTAKNLAQLAERCQPCPKCFFIHEYDESWARLKLCPCGHQFSRPSKWPTLASLKGSHTPKP